MYNTYLKLKNYFSLYFPAIIRTCIPLRNLLQQDTLLQDLPWIICKEVSSHE